jgi:hypothetical protein
LEGPIKRGTPDHPKARALAQRLGLRRFEIVGLLESLWHFAAGYAKRGDVGRFTDEEIASHLEWRGAADELVAALVDSRWLDRCPCHRLRVHDWKDHADQTVTRSEEVKKRGFLECYDREVLPMLVTTSVSATPASQSVPLPLPSPGSTPEPVPPPVPEPDAARPSLSPFIRPGERPAWEAEALRLTEEVAALTDRDGAEVFREAQAYDGQKPKANQTNPANLTEARLQNTVLDLRRMKAEALASRLQQAEAEQRRIEAEHARAAQAQRAESPPSVNELRRYLRQLATEFKSQTLDFQSWCERRNIPPDRARESGLTDACAVAS